MTTTVFIGGSRFVSRLPAEVKLRLDNIVESGHRVVVGDANGADKAAQRHLHDAGYEQVVVFCSGQNCRNNLGAWKVRNVSAYPKTKGYQFYAAKDREMAKEADFGLMIWDGSSVGTVLNVLRLMQSDKISVLFNVPVKQSINIKSRGDWDEFISRCDAALIESLRERATIAERGTLHRDGLPALA